MIIDYIPCKECVNQDVICICYKCGKCGRKFENGYLLNGDEFPGYEPELESEK